LRCFGSKRLVLSSPRRFSNLILDIKPDELGNAIRLGIGVLNSVPAERPLQQERSCCLSAAFRGSGSLEPSASAVPSILFADEGTCISA
jgi:hypothetical protein